MAVQVNAYSCKKDGSKHLTAHFTVREFACNDGSDPVFVAPALPHILEAIRSHFGGRPVIINSGYCTPPYNKSVKGSTYSQHCVGTAADIHIAGVKPSAVAAFAREIMPDFGGVGRYKTFTHIDVREQKADWSNT